MPTKPQGIENFINYQEGSVVSREIINKKTGTVTFFAFAKNQGLSEHKTPYDALVFIIDGQAQITISGKTYKVNKGEMIVMPANSLHSLYALKPFKMVLTMIR